jgi:glycosyltransferase involved in cell wall biosynthesis
MRIGFVIYGSLDIVSGGYLYDRKLVASLRSRGDDVRMIALHPGSYFAHLLDNLSTRLPSDLDVLIEDELVHPSLLTANRAPRSYPVVSLVHNLHSSENRPSWQNALFREVERAHLRSVDGCIFNSDATRLTVTQLVGDGKPSVLAPPGGDRLGRLALADVDERASRAGPLRLLFLANVTPLKGLHVLLDALAKLPRGACTLVVVGSLSVDAAYAAQMQQRAASLETPIAFHGILDEQPLADLLRRSDVLVVPSFWEGFGIVYLEGMAFGLPAIGTTAGAIPQMINHGENGYMIPPGASDALASLLAGLASDRQLLARMSANALEHFSTCPTWDESAGIVRAFLLQMLTAA